MKDIIGTVISAEELLAPQEIKISEIPRKEMSLDAGRKYIIPDFQREIRWEEKQIIELLSNIGEGSKFLGNVILSETVRVDNNGNPLPGKSEKDYEIIDGQQRITTLLMIRQFILQKYGDELDLKDNWCELDIKTFEGFHVLLKSGFCKETAEQDQIRSTDGLNQIPQYLLLWKIINDYAGDKASALCNKSKCDSFWKNLNDSRLNVIINTSGKSAEGIRFFLDVNLKGKKLDTEDVFKSYLFYYDKSDKIRELWVSIKKLTVRLTANKESKPKELYPFMEAIRHSFYCSMYAKDKWKSIELTKEFELSKKATIPGERDSESEEHYRGEHIIDVLKDKEYLRSVLSNTERFLSMAVDVYESDGPSKNFKEYFDVVEGKEKVDSVTISIAYFFIQRILYDDTTLPKAVLMKYFLTTMSMKQNDKDAYKCIFDIYAFNVLFNLSFKKKQRDIVISIVSEKGEGLNWKEELSKAILGFLSEGDLHKSKLAMQYRYAEDDFNETYLSKGLAALYNYFSISKEGKCNVAREQKLKSFLTNTDQFSLEHFIINKSKKYAIGERQTYSVRGDASRCVNSMFNFLFIPNELNNSLNNMTIRDKISVLQGKILDCDYSSMVLSLVVDFFINVKKPNLMSFPELDDTMSVERKKETLDAYFEKSQNPSKFEDAFFAFASKVLGKVYIKISGDHKTTR